MGESNAILWDYYENSKIVGKKRIKKNNWRLSFEKLPLQNPGMQVDTASNRARCLSHV